MAIKVSRGTFARADGRPACIGCGNAVERLRDPKSGHGERGRYQSYCNACHAKYMRQKRAEERQQRELDAQLGRTIPVIVSEEEADFILAYRAWQEGRPLTQAQKRLLFPTGRHHAGLSVDHEARRVRWMAWNWSFYLALLGAVMLTGAWGFR